MSLANLSSAINSLQFDPTFNMGLGLMAASGPSLVPHSFGQDFARGIQTAQQARLTAIQARMAQLQAQRYGLQNNAISGVLGNGSMGGGDVGNGGGDFVTPDQARAATDNLGQPGTAPSAPMLSSANGTPGASYAAPSQPQAATSHLADGMMQDPMFKLGFAFDPSAASTQYLNRAYPQPTDFVKQLDAAGIDPRSQIGRQLIQQNIAKQNYIAPTSLRGGGYMKDPVTGQLVNLPQSSPGFQVIQDPRTGQFQEVPVAGALQAVGAAEAAKAGGKAAVTPYSYVGPDGRTVNTTQGNYVGAVGGAPAAQTPDQIAGNLAARATQMVKEGIPDDVAQAWLQRQLQAANIGAQPVASTGAPAGAIAGPAPGFVQGQESAAKTAQSAPSKQMQDSYGALSDADSSYQQSREALLEMLHLAQAKGVAGGAVGLLPSGVATRFSPDAATYQKLHAQYVALQGKALGSGGTDASRETINEAVPTYEKPQAAMLNGLKTQLNNLDMQHIKAQFLNPIYNRGDEKAYTRANAAFDQNVTPAMVPILRLSGSQQAQAVAQAIKQEPALKPRFEWAYNNGLLK